MRVDSTPLTIVFASHTHMGGTFAVGSHHLARELAKSGHRVFHLSTPITPLHLIRWSNPETKLRFKNWFRFRHGRTWPNGLVDYVPLSLIPWQLAHRLGRRKLYLITLPSIKSVLEQHGFSEIDVLLIDAPSLVDLENLLKPKVLGYRATDLYREIRGIAATDILEQELVCRADFLIGTSKPIMNRLKNLAPGKSVWLLENGVDYELFSTPMDLPPEYCTILSPRLVYVGALDDRFDYQIVRTIADNLPRANTILIGPYTDNVVKQLGARPNVHLLGPRNYENMPAYFQHADIGLLPFSNHPANDARSPMKLFEYGASGLPVVASHTTELSRRALDFVFLTSNPHEFLYRTRQLIENSALRSQIGAVAKRSSEQYSWERITNRLLQEACIKELEKYG